MDYITKVVTGGVLAVCEALTLRRRGFLEGKSCSQNKEGLREAWVGAGTAASRALQGSYTFEFLLCTMLCGAGLGVLGCWVAPLEH